MEKKKKQAQPAAHAEPLCAACDGGGWVRPYDWRPGEAGTGGEWRPGGPKSPGAIECRACDGTGRAR